MQVHQTDSEIGLFLVLMFVIAFFTAVLGAILSIYLSPKEWMGFNILFTVPVVSALIGVITSLLLLKGHRRG